MPSDEERREVAERLRDMACRTNPSWPALMEALGCPGRAVAVQYLADLIEPEERTCRDEGSSETFRCTRCVTFIRRDAVTDGFRPNPIRYCPCCGAKVVKQ